MHLKALGTLLLAFFLLSGAHTEAKVYKLWGGAATINLPKAADVTRDGKNAYVVRMSAKQDVMMRLERNFLPKKARDSSSSKLVNTEVTRLRAEGFVVESSKVRKNRAHIQFNGTVVEEDVADDFRVRVEGVRPRANVTYSAIVTSTASTWGASAARALRSAARSLKTRS